MLLSLIFRLRYILISFQFKEIKRNDAIYTQRNVYISKRLLHRVHVNLKRARKVERKGVGWRKRGKREGKEKLQGEDTRCGQLISHNWKHGFMSSDLERVEKSYLSPPLFVRFTLVFPPFFRSPLFLRSTLRSLVPLLFLERDLPHFYFYFHTCT